MFLYFKGNIIITGAKSRNQVESAYNYLNKILIEHADNISKKNEREDEETLMNIYKDILEENKHKFIGNMDLLIE